MSTTRETTWRAGRFWWDSAAPAGAQYPLRAIIFDLDALTDIECDGHRVAYNAAFAEHHLDFQWSVTRYRQLLALPDERQRIAAELRKRCVVEDADVLTAMLVDEIYHTKTMLFDELIRERDLAPRPGLLDLLSEAFAAGVHMAVVSNGQRGWVEPVVRQVAGDGLVEVVITAEDGYKPMPDAEVFRAALWELGISAVHALAITGSAIGLRAATAAALPAVVITGEGTPDLPAAAAVRPDYAGDKPLRVADCRNLHSRWWATHKLTAA